MANETVTNYANKRNALERIERLEQTMGEVAELLNRLNGLPQQTQSALLLCEAISDLLGMDKVSERVEANRVRRLRAEAKENEDKLNAALEAGVMLIKDEVTEKSLLAVVETDKEGAVVEPGILRFWAANTNPDFKAKILGKKVGDKADGLNEHTLTISAIYELAPTPEAAPATEETAPEATRPEVAAEPQ
jgi:hypothetical protein